VLSKLYPPKSQFFLVITVILGFALIKLGIAPHFGLSVDESHYVLYGMRFDYSYFDHPPLVGWIQGFFLWTLGQGELQARLPAILLSISTSLLCWNFLQPYLKNTNESIVKNAGLWALLGLNASLGVTALGLMLLPDSILFTITFLFIFSAERVRVRGSTQDWLILGLITGIAGLTKYNAIILPLALVITMFTTGEWRQVITIKQLPKAGLAMLIALGIISPVLFWNLKHEFISFGYQQGRILRFSNLNIGNLLISYITQLLAYGPFIAYVAWYGLWRLLWHPAYVSGLTLWICLLFIGLFSFAGLGKPTLPHWWGVLYVLTIPLGIVFLIQSWHKTIQTLIILNTLFALTIQIELAYPFLPMPEKFSLHRDFRGWPTIMTKSEELLAIEQSPRAMIAVPNWSLGSRAIYYAKDPSKILVVDRRLDQFDLWQPIRPEGRDLLFILPQHFRINMAKRYKCARIEHKDQIEIRVPTHKVNQITFAWCYKFAGLN